MSANDHQLERGETHTNPEIEINFYILPKSMLVIQCMFISKSLMNHLTTFDAAVGGMKASDMAKGIPHTINAISNGNRDFLIEDILYRIKAIIFGLRGCDPTSWKEYPPQSPGVYRLTDGCYRIIGVLLDGGMWNLMYINKKIEYFKTHSSKWLVEHGVLFDHERVNFKPVESGEMVISRVITL